MRVAVIDDNEMNRVMVTKLVERIDGCSVMAFSGGPEALAALAAETPDLVLIDYMMPEMDGIEFVGRFRGLAGAPGVPIVMITGLNEKSIRRQALDAGASDFVTKPIDMTELRIRVANLLELREARNQLYEQRSWLAEEVIRATAEAQDREEEIIYRLCRATEIRDQETGMHVVRMAMYARVIATKLDMPRFDREMIYRAAPMHDIGKVAIPDSILGKPGRLDAAEFELMKTHTVRGHDILSGSQSELIQWGAQIALSHHERFDGTGYPHGLIGEAIPLAGRIVAVADVFDALTMKRPYKKAWPLEQARDYLSKNAGSHLDPNCVEAFIEGWTDVLGIHERYGEDTEDAQVVDSGGILPGS